MKAYQHPVPRCKYASGWYSGRMGNDFEKRWERIQEQLRMQASGDVQPRMSSGRTLFGIKSEGERKMDEFARRIEAEQAARRRAAEQAGQRLIDENDGHDSRD